MMEKKKVKNIDIKTYINSESGFSLAEVAVGLAVVGIATAALIGWQINQAKHNKAQEIASTLLALDATYFQVNTLVGGIPSPTTASQTTSTQSETDYICAVKNTDSWKDKVSFVGATTTGSGSIITYFRTLDEALNYSEELSRKEGLVYDEGARLAELLVVRPYSGSCDYYRKYFNLSPYTHYYSDAGCYYFGRLDGSYAYCHFSRGNGWWTPIRLFGMGYFGAMNRPRMPLLIYAKLGHTYACHHTYQGLFSRTISLGSPAVYLGDDLSDFQCGAFGKKKFMVGYGNYKPATYYYYVDCNGRIDNNNTNTNNNTATNTNPLLMLSKNLLDPRIDFKRLAEQGYRFTFNVQNGKLTGITLSGNVDSETNDVLAVILGDKWDKNSRTYKLNNGYGYDLKQANFTCSL